MRNLRVIEEKLHIIKKIYHEYPPEAATHTTSLYCELQVFWNLTHENNKQPLSN